MKTQNLLTLGLITVLVMGIVFMSGCVEEPTKKTASDETTTNENKNKLILKLGETAKTSHEEVTILSFTRDDMYKYYSSIMNRYLVQTAPPGKDFILVEAEIKNIGDDNRLISFTSFSLVDGEGYQYDAEPLYVGEDAIGTLQDIKSGQKIKGKVLFNVPDDAKGLIAQYDFGDIFTGSKVVQWELES